MRLANFIDEAREQILAASVKFASALPVLGEEAVGSLRNHLPLVLDTIARDLEHRKAGRSPSPNRKGEPPRL